MLNDCHTVMRFCELLRKLFYLDGNIMQIKLLTKISTYNTFVQQFNKECFCVKSPIYQIFIEIYNLIRYELNAFMACYTCSDYIFIFSICCFHPSPMPISKQLFSFFIFISTNSKVQQMGHVIGSNLTVDKLACSGCFIVTNREEHAFVKMQWYI